MIDVLRLTISPDKIESKAWEQISRALTLPSLKALAIMPDVHAGYDLPIGGVALLDGHIWPGAVGYDIGCGMCHIATGVRLERLPGLHQVRQRLQESIPVGFASHESEKNGAEAFPNASGDKSLGQAVPAKAAAQLGTLGGGNHFVEFGVNSEGLVGITIHSGSRKAGHMIGEHYMQRSHGPIPVDSDIGHAYQADMQWALDFALANRAVMMERCLEAAGLPKALMIKMINENHNHAEFLPEGVLHRKGATPAMKGQPGIIPANMADGVWITHGLGNEEFLWSASHGAGRTMSRKKAKKTLDQAEFEAKMEGIVADTAARFLDEAPGAYKPIDEVLAAQEGRLVEIIDHFKPVMVVKG